MVVWRCDPRNGQRNETQPTRNFIAQEFGRLKWLGLCHFVERNGGWLLIVPALI
jgi:hypothetical protein